MSAPLRAVLFDWGDTLFHAPHAPEVIVSFLRSAGVPVSEARARALWDELWAAGKTPEEIAKGRDLSPEAHRRVWMELFARADQVVPGLSAALYERVMNPNSWVPYADTRPTLEAIRRRGLKVGVVSNVPADLRPVFAKHGLDGLVDSFTHSFEVGAEKPDPAIFLAAAKALGVKPSETLMVGDHPVDAGAERAGMRVFMLPAEFDGEVRGLERVVRRIAN
ncbi:MAG TPA: HAD-IA family hydrolase [Candidatus Limnocylindria bacterium]|nr:HAD-IA family hydrolase [Candidatus Limnocylindria bacterium]